MKIQKIITVFLFFSIHFCGYTQKLPFEMGFQSDYGYILQSRAEVAYLAQTHPVAYSFYYHQPSNGRKDWQAWLNYPSMNYALLYVDYKKPELGKAIALIPSMFFNFLPQKSKSRVEFKIGTGLVYATNPFDLENNPKNLFISTRLSYVMQGGMYYTYKIQEKFLIKTGIQISHFSNAAYNLPNAGMNIPSVHLGVSYMPAGKTITYQKAQTSKEAKSLSLHASLAGSLVENQPAQQYKKPIYGFSTYLSKDLNKISALNVGIDFSYNLSIKDVIDRVYQDSVGIKKPDFKRLAITLGHELNIGKWALLVQVGGYVYKKFNSKLDKPLYQRYGLKYYIKENIFAGFYLKSHYGAAECAELTLGYKWRLKR